MSSSECVDDDDKGGGGKRSIIMFGMNKSSGRLNSVGSADNDEEKKASTASVEGVYSDAEEDDGPDIFGTDKDEAGRLKKIKDDEKLRKKIGDYKKKNAKLKKEAARLKKIEDDKKAVLKKIEDDKKAALKKIEDDKKTAELRKIEIARLKKIEDDKKNAELKKIENDKKAKEADAEREKILQEKRLQNAAELEAKKISDQELISQLENMKGARDPIEYIVDDPAVMYAWKGRTELLAVSVERKGDKDWCQEDMSQRFWKRKAIMHCLKKEKITLIRMTEDNPGFAYLQNELGKIENLPCVFGFTFDKTKENYDVCFKANGMDKVQHQVLHEFGLYSGLFEGKTMHGIMRMLAYESSVDATNGFGVLVERAKKNNCLCVVVFIDDSTESDDFLKNVWNYHSFQYKLAHNQIAYALVDTPDEKCIDKFVRQFDLKRDDVQSKIDEFKYPLMYTLSPENKIDAVCCTVKGWTYEGDDWQQTNKEYLQLYADKSPTKQKKISSEGGSLPRNINSKTPSSTQTVTPDIVVVDDVNGNGGTESSSDSDTDSEEEDNTSNHTFIQRPKKDVFSFDEFDKAKKKATSENKLLFVFACDASEHGKQAMEFVRDMKPSLTKYFVKVEHIWNHVADMTEIANDLAAFVDDDNGVPYMSLLKPDGYDSRSLWTYHANNFPSKGSDEYQDEYDSIEEVVNNMCKKSTESTKRSSKSKETKVKNNSPNENIDNRKRKRGAKKRQNTMNDVVEAQIVEETEQYVLPIGKHPRRCSAIAHPIIHHGDLDQTDKNLRGTEHPDAWSVEIKSDSRMKLIHKVDQKTITKTLPIDWKNHLTGDVIDAMNRSAANRTDYSLRDGWGYDYDKKVNPHGLFPQFVYQLHLAQGYKYLGLDTVTLFLDGICNYNEVTSSTSSKKYINDNYSMISDLFTKKSITGPKGWKGREFIIPVDLSNVETVFDFRCVDTYTLHKMAKDFITNIGDKTHGHTLTNATAKILGYRCFLEGQCKPEMSGHRVSNRYPNIKLNDITRYFEVYVGKEWSNCWEPDSCDDDDDDDDDIEDDNNSGNEDDVEDKKSGGEYEESGEESGNSD